MKTTQPTKSIPSYAQQQADMGYSPPERGPSDVYFRRMQDDAVPMPAELAEKLKSFGFGGAA
jgi:hypothetical protein